MCRQNQLLGVGAMGWGLGMLTACLFESTFFCGVVGLAILVGGVVLLQKK